MFQINNMLAAVSSVVATIHILMIKELSSQFIQWCWFQVLCKCLQGWRPAVS